MSVRKKDEGEGLHNPLESKREWGELVLGGLLKSQCPLLAIYFLNKYTPPNHSQIVLLYDD